MNLLVRIVCKIFILVLRIVRYIAAKLFPFLHRKDEANHLPPITDDILLDSATGIAAKIRTGMVIYKTIRK